MKSTSFCLFLLIVTFALHPAIAAPAPKSARMSSDGVDLPAVAMDHKFHAAVPYASAILGQRPEELGKVFNAKKSEALLTKHSTQDFGCDWFVLNAEGADVVAFNLTEGRISKAVMLFETVNTIRVQNMQKQLDAHADKAVKVEVKPIEGDGKKLSLMLSFEVDSLEFYLVTHAVDPKIAAALRKHEWVEGMTDEQAIMVGDGPGRYAATYAADASTGKPGGVGAGTVFAESGGGPSDLVIVIQAKNKHEAREEALKRHKNLKDVTKISGDGAKADAGK